MSAALSLSDASLTSAHHRFEAALPAIDRTLRHLFRRLPHGRRDEAIADARAAAWHAWHAWRGLLVRGKDPTAVGVTGIAANAARYVKAGRRLGTGTCGRGAMDVFHGRAQRLGGYKIVGLDRAAESEPGPGSDGWREWLSCDHRVSPAEEACFRVDFAAWLESLPLRNRRIAELLTEGHEGVVVARLVGLSPGRVSQVWRRTGGRFSGRPVRRRDG